MEKTLEDWIKKVTKKQEILGGLSICPHAKKAYESGKIYWSYMSEEPEAFIFRYIEIAQYFDLIVFFNDSKKLTMDDLKRIINNLQPHLPDLVFLPDHPDNPGMINGLNTDNEVYPAILVQPKKALLEARENLKKTKYYDYWSDEYKKEIWSYGDES